MSEILGERAIGVDKFFRTIGIFRSAVESVNNMDKEQLELL
jgi:acyl-homoserine lactone acylase PvdQ